jgi:TM2 domain-containing membrane protein YozV
MRLSIVVLLFSIFSFVASEASAQQVPRWVKKAVFKELPDGSLQMREALVKRVEKGENVRLIAIALDVSLGLFGMHRLYLGTDVKVPIFYTLTVGGACILWIVDLGLLVFAKDIEPFIDNPNVFMWNPKPE